MNLSKIMSDTRRDGLFTRSEIALADYLDDHGHECAMLSIHDLSQRTGASAATIIRFAKKLGFSGYLELRSALQTRLIETVTASRRAAGTFADLDESGNRLRDFMHEQAKYIHTTAEILCTNRFQEVSQELSTIDRIYLYGDGTGLTPCNSFQFWLNRFGTQVILLTYSGRRIFDQIIHITQQERFLAFSFGKENPELRMVLDFVRERGSRSIMVTDLPQSDTAQAADEVFTVERGPLDLFHSMAAPVIFAEALALSIGRIRGDKAVESARQLDETRSTYGLR